MSDRRGDKMDIAWQCYGGVSWCAGHINAGYLCSVMKSIMKIGHNYKYERGKSVMWRDNH